MRKNSKVLVWITLLVVAPAIIIVNGFIGNPIFGSLLLIGYFILGFYFGRPMFFGFMGNMTYIRGRKKKSKEWFKKAYKTKKAKPQVLISYAFLLLVNNDFEEANRVVDEILEMKLNKDEEILAKSNKALVLWKIGKLQAALETMQRMYKETKNSSLYGTYGFLLNQGDNKERALKFNMEAYDFDSKNPVIMENAAEAYLNNGRLNRAEEIFKDILAKGYNFSEPYYYYGTLLIIREKYEEAQENFKKALNSEIPFLSELTPEKIQAKINEVSKIIEDKKSLPEGSNKAALDKEDEDSQSQAELNPGETQAAADEKTNQ